MVTYRQRLTVTLTLFGAVFAFVGCTSARDEDRPLTGVRSGAICAQGGVVGWGDSLTYSQTKIDGEWEQTDPTWLDTLGADLNVDTQNFGVPAQGSAEIAVRQGGLKPVVTLTGNEIPPGSKDPIIVTAISPDDGWTQVPRPGTMKMHGTLAGVDGTLQRTVKQGDQSFAFIPDHPPAAVVSIPAKSVFSGDQGADYRDCTQIIWAGTNNKGQPAAITRDIASMVNWIAEPKRYLVVGTIPSIKEELSATYGARFVDLRGWLITDGFEALGIAPTSHDTAAIAAGKMPPSLMVDNTHFTSAAYIAIGHYFASVVKSMGWSR
jgi:lysophospholipase L1-like esterase